jgi:CubicO group peptidase (beta-lactamase class C family)
MRATLLVLALACASSAEADPARDVVQGDLGRALDSAVQRSSGGAFWGAVLVARKGKVILAKGYGFADYQARSNTPATLFEIASVSKPFTAMAVLKLEQEGKLKTSDTLGKFFPNAPPDKRAITLDHLLTHTSGLSRRLGVSYAYAGDRATYVKHILAQAPLSTDPGTRFSYSNVGYALLAAVVEEVTGKPFEDSVREAIFKPAQARDTGFVGDARLIKAPATTHRFSKEGPLKPAADWHWGWGYRGMGGVVTTARDLLAVDRALRGDAIFTAATRKKLYRTALSSYARGWMVEVTARGTTRVSHSGGVAGYRATWSRYLEEDTCVVVLTNDQRSPHRIEEALTGLLFVEPTPTLRVDVAGVRLNKGRGFESTGLRLSVEASQGGVNVALVDPARKSKVPLALIEIPKPLVRGLVRQLEVAIRARRADDAGGGPECEGGIALRPYTLQDGKLVLKRKLSLQVLPLYRGLGANNKPIVDKRATLIVVDHPGSMWPLLVKLNVAAADELRAALAKALP